MSLEPVAVIFRVLLQCSEEGDSKILLPNRGFRATSLFQYSEGLKVCCYALPVIVTLLVFLRNISVGLSILCAFYDLRMLT